MLFFTFFASPNIPWMLFWLGAGFFMSARHRLTFVIPFIATLLGYTDVAIVYILLVWLCDFADKPLFTSEDHGEGQINKWLARAFPKYFAPPKNEVDVQSANTVEVQSQKKNWRVSPKKIKNKILKI